MKFFELKVKCSEGVLVCKIVARDLMEAQAKAAEDDRIWKTKDVSWREISLEDVLGAKSFSFEKLPKCPTCGK